MQTRLKRAEDDDAAARAEQTGRAGGMAALAGRCTHVWTIDCAAEDAALFNLCAILASIALGPVLPPDESTPYVKAETEKWGKLVREAGIRAN